MKRILPILLVLLAVVAILVSCEPEEVPTTTFEQFTTEEAPKVTTPAPTTTKKKLNMGISEADEGWSFWGDL